MFYYLVFNRLTKFDSDYKIFLSLFKNDNFKILLFFRFNYILIPLTTSENREYLPIVFVSKDIIVNNTSSFIPSDDKCLFGIVSSKMHMTWMRYTAGRLEGRYRYSNTIVYNTFPFPIVSPRYKSQIISHVQEILDIRESYKNQTYAELYGKYMPLELRRAHEKLDIAVDKCYGSQKFKNENERINFYSSYITN